MVSSDFRSVVPFRNWKGEYFEYHLKMEVISIYRFSFNALVFVTIDTYSHHSWFSVLVFKCMYFEWPVLVPGYVVSCRGTWHVVQGRVQGSFQDSFSRDPNTTGCFMMDKKYTSLWLVSCKQTVTLIGWSWLVPIILIATQHLQYKCTTILQCRSALMLQLSLNHHKLILKDEEKRSTYDAFSKLAV